MRCFRCLESVNKRETTKVLKPYGYTFDYLKEPICADCAKYILENRVRGWFLDEVDDDDDEEPSLPIEEAALYYLSSGDPEDTYGYTQEELEEYLKHG